jgi:hypothetical protein
MLRAEDEWVLGAHCAKRFVQGGGCFRKMVVHQVELDVEIEDL